MNQKIISTDTAAFALFDPAALAHRLDDDCDWWSMEQDEILEINRGNCLIFGTAIDGAFEFEIVRDRRLVDPAFQVTIRAPSGTLYLGPGEDITGGELQPERDSHHSPGLFLEVERGHYAVAVAADGPRIRLSLRPTNAPAQNQLSRQLILGG